MPLLTLYFVESFGCSYAIKRSNKESGEMGGKLRAFAILAENLSLVPSAHVEKLTATCSSKGDLTPPASLTSSGACVYVQIPTLRLFIHIIKNKSLIKEAFLLDVQM